MFRDELHWWAGLVATAAGAIIAIGVLPDHAAKWAMGIVAAAGAIAAYNITPPSKTDRH